MWQADTIAPRFHALYRDIPPVLEDMGEVELRTLNRTVWQADTIAPRFHSLYRDIPPVPGHNA